MTVHVVGDPTPLYEEKVAQLNQQIVDLEAENRRLKALLLAQGPQGAQGLAEQVKRLQTMSKAQGDHIKQLEAELSKLSPTATDTRGTEAPPAPAPKTQPTAAAAAIAAKHNRGLAKPKGKKKK